MLEGWWASCCFGNLYTDVDGYTSCCPTDDEVCGDKCCEGSTHCTNNVCCEEGYDGCGEICCARNEKCYTNSGGEKACCASGNVVCGHECCPSIECEVGCAGGSGCGPVEECSVCGDEGADPRRRCIDGECSPPPSCFFGVEGPDPLYVCPTASEELALSVDCENACDGEGLDFHTHPDALACALPEISGSILCGDDAIAYGNVTVDPDFAPYGEYEVIIGADGPGDSVCSNSFTMVVGDSGVAQCDLNVSIELDPPPHIAPLPERIIITVTGRYIRREENPPVRIWLQFWGCDDEPIMIDGIFDQLIATFYEYSERYVPFPIVPVRYVYELDCGDPPDRVLYPHHVRVLSSARCDGTDGVAFHGNKLVPQPVPNCTVTLEALECFTCEEVLPFEASSDAKLSVYKSSNTLYTACPTAGEDNPWAEVVNGAILFLNHGLLFIDPLGLEGSVQLYGGVEDSGWYTPAGQTGEPVEGVHCEADLADPAMENDEYRFNFMAAEQCACVAATSPGVQFDWYGWEVDNCCFQHLQHTLELRVVPLEVERSVLDPVLPERVDWRKSDGTLDYELRLPWCGGCLPDQPSDGNFTLPFMAWPTNPEQLIKYGHAKGWTIFGNSLKAPGPEGSTYNFAPAPGGQ